MGIRLRFIAGALGVAAAVSVAAADPDQLAVPPDAKVAGRALAEYANLWWQWAYSMSPEESAVVDTTGAHCHVNQSGDIWFLAGGYGTSLIQRSCTVPADKHVFFPVINMVYTPPLRIPVTCEQVMRGAALNNEMLLAIAVEIDGELLSDPERYRLKSPECFDLAGGIPADRGALRVYPSATDGYWMMLKPLARGKHVLRFQARYLRPGGDSYSDMAQDIEYQLTVQ